MKPLFFSCLSLMALVTSLHAAEPASPAKIGIVSFRNCIERSQMGQHEQKQMEAMQKQLEAVVTEKEKRLSELTTKLNDSTHVDSLSTEAENELKKEYRAIGAEMNQLQTQYYQMMNQANMKTLQRLSELVGEASKQVAKEQNFSLILNEDSTFFFGESMEISPLVVQKMDTIYSSTQPKSGQETPKTAPNPS